MNLNAAIQPQMDADTRRCRGSSTNANLHLAGETFARTEPIHQAQSICVHQGSSAVSRMNWPGSSAPFRPAPRFLAGCRGVTLVECLVYISVLFIVLGVAGSALYQGMKQSAALRRNAEDIATALRAGERWRAAVRAATGPIRVVNSDDGQTMNIPTAGAEVVYAFHDGAVWRGSDASSPQLPTLPRIATSRVVMDGP